MPSSGERYARRFFFRGRGVWVSASVGDTTAVATGASSVRRARTPSLRPDGRPPSTSRSSSVPVACRSRSERYFGWRPFNMATSGEAMKIDEYEPVSRPTRRANANSRSVVAQRIPEPSTSSDSTGSTAASEVLSERISTWFIDTFMTSAYGIRVPV